MEAKFVTKRLEVKALRLSNGEWAVIDTTGKTTIYNQTEFHRMFEPVSGHICDKCGDLIGQGKEEFVVPGEGAYVCTSCYNSFRRVKKSRR